MYTLYVMYAPVVQQWDVISLRGITCEFLNRKPDTYIDFVLQTLSFLLTVSHKQPHFCL